ncbi:MAG: hypothetical protein KC609_20865, partial [Myxococcales bacterium]|nr:hypothetical protein [Myxococcales bacterium]
MSVSTKGQPRASIGRATARDSRTPYPQTTDRKGRWIMAIALVLALAQPLAARTRRAPLMVEVHKGRVFVNLDHHVENPDQLLATAGRYRSLDRARVFEQRLLTRGVGDFGVGQTLRIVGPNGALTSCAIKRFSYLTRGFAESPVNDLGDLLPVKKPLCGQPVLFGELQCDAKSVAQLKKRERFIAIVSPATIKTQTLVATENASLRRACLATATVRAALAKAKLLAAKQKERLHTDVRLLPVTVHHGATEWICQVSFTTREGDASCGNDDVALHLTGVWR